MAITLQEFGAPAGSRHFLLKVHGFNIDVTVTASSAAVDDWISLSRHIHQSFLGRLVVGLAIDGGVQQADTLNLCVGHRCLIFQLIHAPNVPSSLRNFLMDDGNIFVGFRNCDHRYKLLISKHRLCMFMNPVEMMSFYEFKEPKNYLNFEEMIELIAGDRLGIDGVRMSMEVARSDWAVQRLKNEQVQQAALEAYLAFSLGLVTRVWRFPWL